MQKHCDKCSYEMEDGFTVNGCVFCECHNPFDLGTPEVKGYKTINANTMSKLRTISDVKKEFAGDVSATHYRTKKKLRKLFRQAINQAREEERDRIMAYNQAISDLSTNITGAIHRQNS